MFSFLTEIVGLSVGQAIRLPVMLLQGSASPRWARDITRSLETSLPLPELVVSPARGTRRSMPASTDRQ
jgi:hypothetical protein